MRDLPDGCVRLCVNDLGTTYFDACHYTPTHLALPTPAFEALLASNEALSAERLRLQDKAGRVEGLERDVAALKGVLVEVRAELLAQIADRKQQLASLSHARPGAFDALVFNDKEIGRAKAMRARIDTLLGDK